MIRDGAMKNIDGKKVSLPHSRTFYDILKANPKPDKADKGLLSEAR